MIAVAALAAVLFVWGCNKESANTTANQAAPQAPAAAAQAPRPPGPTSAAGSSYTGAVTETMDAGGYTYVQVDTGAQKVWAAAPQFAVAVGDEVTVPPAMPMSNYHSKTLDRTFDVVYFAGAITPASASATHSGSAQPGQMPAGHPGGPIAAAPTDMDFGDVGKAEGGNTVSELLTDASAFSGQEITIRGKVVKFNAGIMGKNWIHIQDGTGEPGLNDLTVTTSAFAAVGDTVLVKGVAATDRDFGYGYKYAFIIEDASVSVE
jgi:hypothetical protein